MCGNFRRRVSPSLEGATLERVGHPNARWMARALLSVHGASGSAQGLLYSIQPGEREFVMLERRFS